MRPKAKVWFVMSGTDAKSKSERKKYTMEEKAMTKLMKEAAQNLEFEQAMKYRDKLKELEALRLRNG